MVAYSRFPPSGAQPSGSKIFRPWEDSDEESKNKTSIPKCCGVEFKKKREYRRHTQATARHGQHFEKCHVCDKEFTRRDNLTRHVKVQHESDEKPKCRHCGKKLSRRDAVQRHEGTCHNNPNRSPPPRNRNQQINPFSETIAVQRLRFEGTRILQLIP